MSNPVISIIIRTLNEERYLGELLKSINNQQVSFGFEVILIDSGSDDNTIPIAKSYSCRILHISRQDFSFGRSLNRACAQSFGSYLVFISGHCIPCGTDWLENLVQPLADGSVQYTYGRQLGGRNTYWSECQIFSKYFPISSSIPQQGFYCNNANSAIVASVWDKYKFDEDLTGLEDLHLAKRLIRDGGSIGYVATAPVFHIHHETWKQVKRRFEREALALQQICPEVLLRRTDVSRYFIRAIINDLISSFPTRLSFKLFINIILYRYNQYLGSYIGNHMHKSMSRSLKDNYFYPTQSKGQPLSTSFHSRPKL